MTGFLIGNRAHGEIAMGDIEGGYARALECVAMCKERDLICCPDPWLALVRAHIELGRRDAAEAVLNEAVQLIDKTEINLFKPILFEERARFEKMFDSDLDLVEERKTAHQLFLVLGADNYASRVATQLG